MRHTPMQANRTSTAAIHRSDSDHPQRQHQTFAETRVVHVSRASEETTRHHRCASIRARSPTSIALVIRVENPVSPATHKTTIGTQGRSMKLRTLRNFEINHGNHRSYFCHMVALCVESKTASGSRKHPEKRTVHDQGHNQP